VTEDDRPRVSGRARWGIPQGQYARRYALAALVNSLGSGMFYPFMLLFFTERLGLPLVSAGAVLTFAALVSAACVSFTSRALDRFGARNVIIVLAITRALLFPVYLAINNVWLFALVATAVAIADRTDMVAGQVIVSELAEEKERPAWFALSRMTLNAGLGAGALLGGALLALTGQYALIVVANAVSFLLVALLYLPIPSRRRQSRPGSAEQGADGPSMAIWRDRLMVCFATVNGLWILAGLAIEIGLPVYLVVTLGLPEWTISLVFLVNTLLVTLLQLPVSARVARHPAVRMFGYGLVAYAITFAMLALSPGLDGAGAVVFVVVAVCVFTAGEMITSVTGMVVVTELAPPHRLGGYVGLQHTFLGVGSAMAPLVYSAGLAWSPQGLWSLLAVLMAVLAAASILMRSHMAARASASGPVVAATPGNLNPPDPMARG